MNTTEQKIKLIQQAIELKTGSKCDVEVDSYSSGYARFSYKYNNVYYHEQAVPQFFISFLPIPSLSELRQEIQQLALMLPLSETEVNGVTENNGEHHIPYCCPVCTGVGTVHANFYSQMNTGSNAAREQCRSCNGSGIVYSLPAPPINK